MNINKNFCGVFVVIAALCGATMFAGCGDDNSASVDDEQSSSSVEEPTSSSSADAKSSSSSKEKTDKSSSSSKEDKTAESSSSVNGGEPAERSSSSVTDSLVEKLGKCEDKGQFEVSHIQDDAGNWYSCYRGEWSEGFLEVEGPDWGKNPGGQSSSSESKMDSAVSSSSEMKLLSSSSDALDWSIPKEAYLNPDIRYDSIVDERDGQVYKTVKIGEQVWMAQNLNYVDSVKTPSLLGRNKCENDDPNACNVVGHSYTWAAAVDSVKLATDPDNPRICGMKRICDLPDTVHGICPNGWHLPSYKEWDTLFETVGRDTSAKALKSKVGWNYGEPGIDAVGFSAIPTWCGKESCSIYFWTTSQDVFSDEARSAYVSTVYESSSFVFDFKKTFLSVRCIKD